ncbi:MAG TPA: glycosyltransferase, partial [Saprospiraceae bacterium]|nr:glycosyltransferase [Saprospiraceae bacterium]
MRNENKHSLDYSPTIVNNHNVIVDNRNSRAFWKNELPEVLIVTTYPPRECGIATYSQDLINAINGKFKNSFSLKVCALESESENHIYPKEVKYILNTSSSKSYIELTNLINQNDRLKLVVVQHEFGLFNQHENDLQAFLYNINKPLLLVFHTVLPHPDDNLKQKVRDIVAVCDSVVVMTKHSAELLFTDYGLEKNKINVIPHGTHLVQHHSKNTLKAKYGFRDRKVLTTFGLLSSGKGIENTLEALPVIIKQNPEVIFLIIGKTHPSVVKSEGEQYRNQLENKVSELQIQDNVKFINRYLSLHELLEYLQLTDIYLFTSKDPNQAVSGTFSYAISCGCPIISTPIPHAQEVLRNDAGIIIDFDNSEQLAEAVIKLLGNDELRKSMSLNSLQMMAATSWENSAISHALLFQKIGNGPIALDFQIPAINLDHLKSLTTNVGMIQFSHINKPDIESGYTLDDNARALIAMCQHYELTRNIQNIEYITIYYNFIAFCQQPDGYFYNYVDQHRIYTEQNNKTNLDDANGRAIWALGYLISLGDLLPKTLIEEAEKTMQLALLNINRIYSTRAMAFVIKGLYHSNMYYKSENEITIINELANRLANMYQHEADKEWMWFESYLTYANSILPEAMLYAWEITGNITFRDIARSSFEFLLSKTFRGKYINVISNKTWLHKNNEPILKPIGGEQPIDVAYKILALTKFHEVFKESKYLNMIEIAFNWFLGNNHLNQIIYNPCTGGCYDGLEEHNVNLNQGAESTVSYLMA